MILLLHGTSNGLFVFSESEEVFDPCEEVSEERADLSKERFWLIVGFFFIVFLELVGACASFVFIRICSVLGLFLAAYVTLSVVVGIVAYRKSLSADVTEMILV